MHGNRLVEMESDQMSDLIRMLESAVSRKPFNPSEEFLLGDPPLLLGVVRSGCDFLANPGYQHVSNAIRGRLLGLFR
jgi:hypothetical protein